MSPREQPVPPNLAEAALRVNRELTRRADEPMSLSPSARRRLELLHAEYLADVGREAARLARRANLTTVDESHVDKANERLGTGGRGSAVETAANTLGGVFAGAGIASIYSLTFTPGPHGLGEQIVTIALNVIGFVLLAVGMTLAMVRRGH